MNINTIEEDEAKGIVEETEVRRRDEEMPKEVTARTFVQKLAKGEKFQNWET